MDSRDERAIGLKIIYWIVAVIVVAALCLLVVRVKIPKQESRTQYSVVLLGDSLVGLCRDETSVASVMEEMLGQPVFNGAFGGTCMALQDQEAATNYTMELLNMVSLSKALAADDFGVQQTVRSRREITDYFMDTIDELAQVDFKQVQTLVLAFGINDYHAGMPLENAGNPFDESTFGGALRSVLRTLQGTYPDLRIILVTPTYAWYRSNGLTCEEYATGDAFLEEYVAKELEIAQEYGIEAIDLYHDLYPHETWEDWQIYTEDGLHPNESGRRLIAETLVERLEAE